jgi:anti-repressor protein
VENKKSDGLALVTPETLGISVRGNVAKVSSLTVAEKFGKRHGHVIRDIETKILGVAPEYFNRPNFGLVEYQDAKGETRKSYDLTRDGFSLLAMGFTGAKAMLWKVRYIQAFNMLEREALGQSPQSSLPATVTALAHELERQRAINKQQEPLALYAYMTQISDDAMSAADFARQMCQSGVNTGRNRFYKWLCRKGYAYEPTRGKYLPLQKGVGEEILQYGSRITIRPDGTICKRLALFVTGRGQVRLANDLKKEADERFNSFRQRQLWGDDISLAPRGAG